MNDTTKVSKAASKHIVHGFEPILGAKPTVLVLGTLPSVKSLEKQQYYGHPRNTFWWIMSELCGFSDTYSYPEGVDALRQNNIAVWDVIRACHRPGSLDARIDQSTLSANDFSGFLASWPSIQVIAFNGQAASKLFSQHVVLDDWQGDFIALPSTSPANASMTKEAKLKKWKALKAYL